MLAGSEDLEGATCVNALSGFFYSLSWTRGLLLAGPKEIGSMVSTDDAALDNSTPTMALLRVNYVQYRSSIDGILLIATGSPRPTCLER